MRRRQALRGSTSWPHRPHSDRTVSDRIGPPESTLDAQYRSRARGPAGKWGERTESASRAAAIVAMHRSVVGELGEVDVVGNNAGTSRAMDFMEITDELWNEDLELKLMGAVRLIRLTFPSMLQRRWGRIINVLNVGAKAPKAGGAPTAVSRAAGMALTKVLAGEGAPHNVLVNAMLVGLIESDQHLQRHLSSGSNDTIEEYYEKIGAAVPMGRVGKPEEFAAMACFLASEAGSYITGTAINVDGNRAPVV